MKLLNNFILEKLTVSSSTKVDKDDKPKKVNCSFVKYENVTQEMVDAFWDQERYAEKLIPYEDIRKEFQGAYEKAKKNVAMLEYPMTSSYTVYFDKDANLTIWINHGASWSAQNHLSHYASKCGKYFKLQTAAWCALDEDKWELLFKGNKS